MDKSPTNILIVGVGGQGILLASEIIAATALDCGLDVKQSEVHGMAQRGGSVSSHVRFGKTVHSPVIEYGTADLLLAFELLEALRWIGTLKSDGIAIVNDECILPVPVAQGTEKYPENIQEKLKAKCGKFIPVDGRGLAQKAGHIKAVNVVLLGVLSCFVGFKPEAWQNAVRSRVPEKAVDINLKAFQLGRDAIGDG